MRMQRADWLAMQSEAEEVLTLAEAAKYLKVSERTLWGLAKENGIPHYRVGSQYRFSRNSLRQLLEQKNPSEGGNS